MCTTRRSGSRDKDLSGVFECVYRVGCAGCVGGSGWLLEGVDMDAHVQAARARVMQRGGDKAFTRQDKAVTRQRQEGQTGNTRTSSLTASS